MKTVLTLAGTSALALLLTSCAAPNIEAPSAQAPTIEHVHGIAAAPTDGGDLYIATHNGIFVVSNDGTLAGPIGGHDFDAMGFTISGETFFASGHPGPSTPSELGAENLGIIRSEAPWV